MYTLRFGSQKIPVYCHMGHFGCGDGGWTLAMKIDGTKVQTFSFPLFLYMVTITDKVVDLFKVSDVMFVVRQARPNPSKCIGLC